MNYNLSPSDDDKDVDNRDSLKNKLKRKYNINYLPNPSLPRITQNSQDKIVLFPPIAANLIRNSQKDQPLKSTLSVLNNQRSNTLPSPTQRNVSAMEWETKINQPTTSQSSMEVDQNASYLHNPQAYTQNNKSNVKMNKQKIRGNIYQPYHSDDIKQIHSKQSMQN